MMSLSARPSVLELAQILFAQSATIEEWLCQDTYAHQVPFYSSVDIRRAHHKIAVIDTNLFPGGFNNLLWPHDPRYYTELMQQTLQQYGVSGVRRILLIPENHTRNLFYQDNIRSLVSLLERGCDEVRIGYLQQTSTDGTENTQETIWVDERTRQLHCGDYHPDLILLNNDLSHGVPALLTNIAQPILPPPYLGWAHRKKSAHFQQLSTVLEMFCQEHQLPYDVFRLEHRLVSSLNLQEAESYERLAEATDAILTTLRTQNPEQPPYVVLKDNSGTYGLGVICVEDPIEIVSLNRKNRKKLSTHKGGRQHKVTEILIQEGIESIDTHDGLTAEPVIYMMGNGILSGFYRRNERKHARDNLNSVGSSFRPFQLFGERLTALPPYQKSNFLSAEHYLLSVLARLAALAAAREYAALPKG